MVVVMVVHLVMGMLVTSGEVVVKVTSGDGGSGDGGGGVSGTS